MMNVSTNYHLCVCFRIRDNVFVMFIILISGVFWLHRLVKFIYNICCYWEIRSFYVNALKMSMVGNNTFTRTQRDVKNSSHPK